MDNIKQTITENSVVYLYLFPELTDEDIEILKAYGLNFAGKNHGATGDEDNWVVTGSKTALERYAEKWLGYELHPDYLYEYDDFAGEIVNEACEVEENIEQLEIDNDDSVEGIVTFDRKICESFEDVTLEEVLEWLSEHDTAYEDVQMYFNTKDLEELDKEEIISWIADYNQLYDDFKSFFKDRLTLDEAVGRPSQATLDDCLEYYKNNAFGYNGVEDYVDTEFPMHSQEFKAEVVNYIKERKNESLSEYTSVNEDSQKLIAGKSTRKDDLVGNDVTISDEASEYLDEDELSYVGSDGTVIEYDDKSSRCKVKFGDGYIITLPREYINESKSIKEDADNWSFDKAIDWLTDIAMDQYLYSTRDDNAFWSAVGLALDHETLPAVLKTPGARKKIMQIAPRMVASKYYAKIHRFDRPHKNESKSIKESRPDKDIITTTNKVTIKYGNSVKEVETCKPIKVTKKQLDSYKDNYSIVDVLEESKFINEGARLTVDSEGLKKCIRPLCQRAIDELELPIESFTLSNGNIIKYKHPVYFVFEFNIHLKGPILPTYKWQQSEDEIITLKIRLTKIPTNVNITPELLCKDNLEDVKNDIRDHVFTESELENHKSILEDKLNKVSNICDEIGSKYSIKLEPSFYPSIEELDGTPDERITLYVKPVEIEGKLGNFQPSNIHSGYMGYTVDNIEYSTDMDYVDHKFGVDAANFKLVDYELDYNQIYNEIENRVQNILQSIDKVDSKIKLHAKAEKELDLQLETINKQIGSNILTKNTEPSIYELGFSILCDINGKTFKDYIDEKEVLDPNFWKKYMRKVNQRIRSTDKSKQNSRVNNSTRIDFEDEDSEVISTESLKEGVHRIYVNGELKDEIESSNPVHEVDPIAYKYKKLNGVKEVRVNYADGTTNTMQVESINESSYKKGDKVELDNGMTGTVTKDFD